MRQKVLKILMLFCVSMYSASSWAEFVRPTIPETSLVSGNSYYLYNVETDLFAHKEQGGLHIKEDPSDFIITSIDNGFMTIKNGNDYLYRAYDGVRLTSWEQNNTHWSLILNENEYLIQCPEGYEYYNPEHYLGWMGNNATEINYSQPVTGAVHWKLIPANADGDRYVASLKLYKEIQKTEMFVENGYSAEVFKYYTDLYSSRTTADIDEMTEAAVKLRYALSASQGYNAPYWNEYPIMWENPEGDFSNREGDWNLTDNNTGLSTYLDASKERKVTSLSAIVKVEKPSVIGYDKVFERAYDALGHVSVYVDGVLMRTLREEQDGYFFEQLSAGTHKITWVATIQTSYGVFRFKNIGIMESPLISVNLLEPGSLGTEILYNTDHIKNVRRLKVTGEMNNEDWTKIKMMHYLQDLDLSEAIITEIPEKQFSCEADTASNFLHKMRLPEGLKTIHASTFQNSRIDNLIIPSTLTTIGMNAFRGSHIKEIVLPENCELLYNKDNSSNTFCDMKWLERLVFPKNLRNIGNQMCTNNIACKEVVLPEELEEVGYEAFKNNPNMTTVFPNKLKHIGVRAFNGCHALESVKLKNIESIDIYAFEYCGNLKEVEIGQFLHTLNRAFANCPKLETLRLNCANLVLYKSGYDYPVSVEYIPNVRLLVPNHLVTSYKLDQYWYNFKSVEGFNTSEIQDWMIYRPLVLNRERLEGSPNIHVQGNYNILNHLKINGDNAQVINDLTMGESTNNYENYPAQLFSNCNNVTINGKAGVELTTYDRRWYFFSLPFDLRVSDIISKNSDGNNVQKAIRYYDGTNRATIGGVGSWKNFEDEAIIPAGTGFIMQTNYTAQNYFPSFNETKQNMFASTELVKTLEECPSDTEANKGWNLVGNPWQCFFNSHYLNFAGPITVWDTYNRTYKAYSITDDDYAIRPNEAFFVQCPNAEQNTIGFPAEGRQLNAEIVSQNPTQAKLQSCSAPRILTDITITDGNSQDRTRVVLNENALMDYELSCDASKMMSMDVNVPQIFTMNSDGTRYAINERPIGDGTVKTGISVGKSGKFSIRLNRSTAENVTLVDLQNGKETDLVNEDYTFYAEAGTHDGRFMLRFSSDITTNINKPEITNSTNVPMYNVSGQKVSDSWKGIVIQNGRKVFTK